MKSSIKKLHTNNCHMSGQQMYEVLQDCGKWTSEEEKAMKEVLENCENLDVEASNFSLVKQALWFP